MLKMEPANFRSQAQFHNRQATAATYMAFTDMMDTSNTQTRLLTHKPFSSGHQNVTPHSYDPSRVEILLTFYLHRARLVTDSKSVALIELCGCEMSYLNFHSFMNGSSTSEGPGRSHRHPCVLMCT